MGGDKARRRFEEMLKSPDISEASTLWNQDKDEIEPKLLKKNKGFKTRKCRKCGKRYEIEFFKGSFVACGYCRSKAGVQARALKKARKGLT